MEQQRLIALVNKARAGDSGAMEQLLTIAHTTVSYQCRKFMNSPEDAEDMTQEVLMVIYQKLDTLTDPAAFNGWVKRIAATRCMNAVSRTHVDLQFAEDEEGNSILDTIEELDAQKVPEAALDNAETSRMVVELIDALPEAQRICTYLFYYNELSIKEIAELTAATENTVKSRLNYARKAIKEGVLEHEKKGIKLYGLSPLPFLVYFLHMAAQAEGNSAAAASCVTGVMAANAATTAAVASAAAAATNAAAAGTTAAATTATTAATATTATAVSGKAAVGVAGFLSKKLIVGIVAGAVALGGGAVATVQLVNTHAETVPAIICHHEWEDANCVAPKNCSKCDSVEGEALGHIWNEADCEHPQTCQTCSATEGEAWGHTWTEATCETAQVCQTCGEVGGEALGHNMAEANYQQPARCTREGCTYTEGEKKPADYMGAVINAEFGKEYDYFTACWNDTNYSTVGKLTLSNFGAFESAEGYEAVEGYMYYTVTVNILFSDKNAQKYAPAASGRYGFLYNEAPYSAGEETENQDADGMGRAFTADYCGKKYTQGHIYWTDWEFSGWDMKALTCVATKTLTWRVPVGYDGLLLMFCDRMCEPVEGQYSWQFLNPGALVFRFPMIDLTESATEETGPAPEITAPNSGDSSNTGDDSETSTPEGGQEESETEAERPSNNNAAAETDHTHNYTTKTVAPTTEAEGYDEHICSCGSSYRDNYTPKIEEDHTGAYKQLVSPGTYSPDYGFKPAVWDWIPWDCATQGHRCQGEGSHTSVVQEETCCQPQIIKTTCAVVGCDGYETKETGYADHIGDASLLSYESYEFYAVRGSDGYAWTFNDEASVRAKAKQIADAYRNGESYIYVEWIRYTGYRIVRPETFTCTTCGQVLSYQEVRNRTVFKGTYPENPYTDRYWEETYTKDNQPDW